jgi:hypothetical protein
MNIRAELYALVYKSSIQQFRTMGAKKSRMPLKSSYFAEHIHQSIVQQESANTRPIVILGVADYRTYVTNDLMQCPGN